MSEYEIINQCEIINIQKQDNLSLVQIQLHPQNTFNYISLQRALDNNEIEIKEISQSGSVNNILVKNNSIDTVFVMDGDILKGAKQNRVLNTSVLLPPKSKTIVPVSCVESGRWNNVSDRFSGSDEIAFKNIRHQKHADIFHNSSQNNFKHYANQSRVWSNVSSCSDAFCVDSKTSSHSDAFAQRRNDFNSYVNTFSLEEKSNGLGYFIGDKLMGIEVFNRSDVYADYFYKILTSIGMELNFNQSVNNLNNNFISESLIVQKMQNAFFDFDSQENDSMIDFCNGVSLGSEKRMSMRNKMFYSLSFDNHLIHKSLLVSDSININSRRGFYNNRSTIPNNFNNQENREGPGLQSNNEEHEVTRCLNGHFYRGALGTCPFCVESQFPEPSLFQKIINKFFRK